MSLLLTFTLIVAVVGCVCVLVRERRSVGPVRMTERRLQLLDDEAGRSA